MPQSVSLIMKNSDQTEGRGPYWPLHGFIYRPDAEKFLLLQGRLFVADIIEIPVYKDFSEYSEKSPEFTRRRTIEKLRKVLTEAEFNSLGIKE